MNNKLEKKIREVEEEHFGEIEQTRIENFDKEFEAEAHRFQGALLTVTSMGRSLFSKSIEGLMQVEDKNYYLYWTNPATGEKFHNFVEYLNSDEVPDLSKSKYYELKALLLNEGPEVFDVFSGKKLIPKQTRKMLAAAGVQISLDGDDLVIADQRVAITDKAAMKELVETVHEVLRERDVREGKKDKKINEQAAQIEQGIADNEELQRNLDALKDGDPYDAALMRALDSLVKLTNASEQLKPAEKAKRGGVAMRSLWVQFLNLKKSLASNFIFEDSQTTHSSDLDEIAAQVLDGDDD